MARTQSQTSRRTERPRSPGSSAPSPSGRPEAAPPDGRAAGRGALGRMALLAAAFVVGALLVTGFTARDAVARWARSLQPPPVGGRVVLPRLNELVVLDVGSRQERTLFQYGMSESVTSAAWSPDGSTVAFGYYHRRQGDATSSGEIYLIGADGSNMRPLAERARAGDVLDSPVWAPDGQTLYFSAAGLSQGRPFQRLERLVLASGERSMLLDNAQWPALSQDGRLLAFIREERGSPGLWVMELPAGQPRSLVPAGRFLLLAGPRFSPDGQQIAVAISDPGVASRLDGGPFGLLLPRRAYAHGDPWDIWTVPLGGGDPKRLTYVNADEPYPLWVPDGTHVGWWAINGLWIVPSGGGDPLQIADKGGYGAGDWTR